ncbi:hypothetical protein IMY05_010G0175400 [Salix suchowensis]|nr:hypothetical protein IMY05_010G0175400 [Salix suchowensis]
MLKLESLAAYAIQLGEGSLGFWSRKSQLLSLNSSNTLPILKQDPQSTSQQTSQASSESRT